MKNLYLNLEEARMLYLICMLGTVEVGFEIIKAVGRKIVA